MCDWDLKAFLTIIALILLLLLKPGLKAICLTQTLLILVDIRAIVKTDLLVVEVIVC